jgi:transcriptional regulator with XRE-family HTH domain
VKHWTQQHLADTAGIQLRTVQRVEKGDGASNETLGALANAFNTSINFMLTDLVAMASKLEEERDAIKKTHDLIPVAPVTCSADLEVVAGADACVAECASKSDAVQDIFAALRSELKDMGDLWGDVDPWQHREWMKSAYVQVEEVEPTRRVVCVGKAKLGLPGLKTLLRGL